MVNQTIKNSIDIWVNPAKTFTFIKGRVALYAILRSIGVGPGDEVLIPGFTCVVVPAAICYTGAKPIFYDINPNTYNGEPKEACNKVTKKTKAIMIQHTFGVPADCGDILDICQKNGIYLIEDCAHAIGASKNTQPVGTIGDAAFCSLQWSKLVTSGLGGIALSQNSNITARLKEIYIEQFKEPSIYKTTYLRILSHFYRNYFDSKLYWPAQKTYRWAGCHGLIQGSSSRQELQNSVIPKNYCERFGKARLKSLYRMLKTLPENLLHRQRIANLYRNHLIEYGYKLQHLDRNNINVPLRFPLLVKHRDSLLRAARKRRIEIGDWFNAPLHPNSCNAKRFGYRKGECPITEFTARHIINLPTHINISDKVAFRIMEFLNEREHLFIRE